MRRRTFAVPVLAALVAAGAACGGHPATPDGGPSGPYDWAKELPHGFPKPYVPPDNPMTYEKVRLGHYLFYDQKLSGNQTSSCSSCHIQSLGFSNDSPTGIGSTGQVTPRNVPGLLNAAYYSTYTWLNPQIETIEQFLNVPMFGEDPVELGITGHEKEVLARFRDDPMYQKLFAKAFPGDSSPVSFDHIQKALACFVRTMISGNSDYDRYVYGGDKSAMSTSELRGEAMFFDEKHECYHCHGGFNLTQASRFAGDSSVAQAFFNTGLYNIGGTGAYPKNNQGLYEFTGNPKDMGKFRAPSLRNVELTAPYFHDGTAATLDDVLKIYAAGGRNITSGPFAGDGRANPYKNGFIRGFTMSAQDESDLLAFLHSFTDKPFTTATRWSNPFVKGN